MVQEQSAYIEKGLNKFFKGTIVSSINNLLSKYL